MSISTLNNTKVVNYRPVSLKDFSEGDEYYVQKLFSGYAYSARCRFVKLERGVVHGVVIENYVSRGHRVPLEMENGAAITAKPNKCYLYGRDASSQAGMDRCIWFKNSTDPI